ncbi:uncharacterized protein LOC125759517 [Rhipicephalus sanguineus]|uniref:uncharacterized protein LOC125759517 n=1 Tax=Rhipicephalus sanguineus TaxID=34632 RepID=UPI0020C4AB78|nr:uncharacterized protein LOC125759517 [Rhipicephalus sanguineus]
MSELPGVHDKQGAIESSVDLLLPNLHDGVDEPTEEPIEETSDEPVLLVNCRSIKNKRDDFASLVETVQPHVVLGTESWLDNSIANIEVFPPGFTVFRKDRHRHGGGVFILISNGLPSEELHFETDTESVWCRVHFPKGHKLVFGSFYRPPDSNEIPIQNLADTLSVLSDTVFLGGDFNLPDITWTSDGAITNKSRINTSFKELLMLNNLTQYVLVPTRQQATLDLVLCNDPSVVTKAATLEKALEICTRQYNHRMPTSSYGDVEALGTNDLLETIRVVVREEMQKMFPRSQAQVDSIAVIIRW